MIMKEWTQFSNPLLAPAMRVGLLPAGAHAASSGKRAPAFKKVHENEMRGVAL